MKLFVYAVFDHKAKIFQQPWYSVNLGTAARSFEALVNDGQSMVSRWPEDFTLYQVAEFDDVTGEFASTVPPMSCGLAAQFVRETK